MSLNQNTEKFSLVIISPGSKKPLSISFAKWLYFSLLAAICFVVIGTGLLIYLYTSTSAKLMEYRVLKNLTASQKNELDRYQLDLDELSHKVENLLEKEEKISDTLNQSKLKTNSQNSRNKRKKYASKVFKDSYNKIKEESLTKLLEKKVDFVKKEIESLEDSISEHFRSANHQKIRFDHTPSIWPIRTTILSGFGRRVHPITGRVRQHQGIDLPSWVGAPIKVTADGIVEYSGWSGTFGYVVVVNHDFGYRTLYAHCSKLLVDTRESVKKGQIIAQVGTTGISTGPHLHYEIRRWRQAVSPITYLDLDIFTASTRVW